VCKNRNRNGVTGNQSGSAYLPGPGIEETAIVAATEERAVVAATMRASDHERERVVAQLGEHMSAGRITLAEYEERVAGAYAATHVGDLDRLTADLPAIKPQPARMPARVGVVRTALDLRRGPWGTWLFVGLICMAIWLMTSVASGQVLYFWPVWVIGPWGLAMLSRTRSRSHRA
jgi:Domain of unknown function (DUF1707)